MDAQKIEEIKSKIEETKKIEKTLRRLIILVRVFFFLSLSSTIVSGGLLIAALNLKNAITFFVNVFCLVICSIVFGQNSYGKRLLKDAQELEKEEKELIEH